MKKNFFWSEHVSSQIWCYLKLVRWRDEEWDEQMKKIFFWSEHVSSQIWFYLKLVRWRVRWRDEQIKKFFLVRTCIKPNLVLSEISEMKSEMKRWTDEEKFFGSEHVSSQIWCYLKLVRWRDEMKWDEEMKKIFFLVRTCIKPNLVLSEISEMKSEMKRWADEKIFFWSEHVSSQIWCYLKLVRWRDEEWDEEMKR